MDSGAVQTGTKVALQATVLSSAAPAGSDPSAVAAPAALPLPLPMPGGGMVVVQQVQPAPLVQQQGAAVAASAAALPIASPAELKVGKGCGMCECTGCAEARMVCAACSNLPHTPAHASFPPMQGVFGSGDTPMSGSLEAILDELGK